MQRFDGYAAHASAPRDCSPRQMAGWQGDSHLPAPPAAGDPDQLAQHPDIAARRQRLLLSGSPRGAITEFWLNMPEYLTWWKRTVNTLIEKGCDAAGDLRYTLGTFRLSGEC